MPPSVQPCTRCQTNDMLVRHTSSGLSHGKSCNIQRHASPLAVSRHTALPRKLASLATLCTACPGRYPQLHTLMACLPCPCAGHTPHTRAHALPPDVATAAAALALHGMAFLPWNGCDQGGFYSTGGAVRHGVMLPYNLCCMISSCYIIVRSQASVARECISLTSACKYMASGCTLVLDGHT